MFDKNGIKLMAGDVVEIKGAYFKNDNGFWYVEQDGTNKANGATEDDITLRRIGKTGKISTARGQVNFFPLRATISGLKRFEVDDWNREHATIEKVTTVKRDAIISEFEQEYKNMIANIKHFEKEGFGESFFRPFWDNADYCQKTVERMKAEENLKK